MLSGLDISKLDQFDPLQEEVYRSVTEKEVDRWVESERDEVVQNAVVNDTLEFIEKKRSMGGKETADNTLQEYLEDRKPVMHSLFVILAKFTELENMFYDPSIPMVSIQLHKAKKPPEMRFGRRMV